MDSRLESGDLRRVGPYQLIGRLGQGGMGTVYLATDPQGRQVAVKLVRSDLMLSEQFRRRFRSEVTRARQVPPFCTAEVIDADPYHDPPYLVVEYIDGPSLYEVVQRRGPLTGANLHSVAVGIATALSAIHGAGVIHRDLKPGNVLFGLGGIKVIDFGIARALDPTSQHTRTNQMVGTVSYMAPERFDHEASSRAGTAADIFAWGAVVAYAGTGRTPFGADSGPATAVRILTQPPELFDLAEPMRSLVEQALAKDPRDRPTSRELFDRLLAAAPQHQGQGHQSTSAGRAPSASMRDTPFLREIVEAAAGNRPSPSPPPIVGQAHIPMTARRSTKRGRPRWLDALQRVQVAAVAAVVLVVTAAVVTVLNVGAASPDASADQSAEVVIPLAAPSSPAPGALLGERRVALRLTGTSRELGVEDQGRVSLADQAEPIEFVLTPLGDSHLIKSVPQRNGDAERCLVVRNAAALALGSCVDTLVSAFVLTAAGADKYVIASDRYGVVHWSYDRRAISLEPAGGGAEATTFTIVDHGPS